MFTVGKKVSFSLVVALLVGWGAFSILFLQASNTLLEAQNYELDRPIPLPPGVRLNFQVDKKIYRSGETVLLALRNDSRLNIWLAEHADGCQGSWWRVEMLGSDGETWTPLALTKDSCTTKKYGLVKFPRHTIQTGEWLSVIPAGGLGNLVVPAEVGTYRVAAPYLKGGAVKEANWEDSPSRAVVSPTFTIQSK